MEQAQLTQWRRWAFKCVLVALVGGVCLAAEFAVRAFYTYKKVYIVNVDELLYASGPLQSYGEELGWSLNPGVVQRRRTGFGDVVQYRTGKHGFRVQEGQEPTADDTDILFVGDSVTFGYGANRSFPLEFAQTSSLKAVNAGVPGYGTDQAFLMTRKVIESLGFEPRDVVYGFYWNDLMNNASPVGIDFDPGIVAHKPILNLENGLYERAEVEKNDLTKMYSSPTAGEALLIRHS